MRLFHVSALIALLAGAGWWISIPPARAQSNMPDVNLMPEIPSKTPEQKAADAKRDQAYKESLRKIPDGKASDDPWGSMRGDAPKAAGAKAPRAKTSVSGKKATKTGSASN